MSEQDNRESTINTLFRYAGNDFLNKAKEIAQSQIDKHNEVEHLSSNEVMNFQHILNRYERWINTK